MPDEAVSINSQGSGVTVTPSPYVGAGGVARGPLVIPADSTIPDLPEHADNAAALGAGLTAGRLYRTATGVVMVVYSP